MEKDRKNNEIPEKGGQNMPSSGRTPPPNGEKAERRAQPKPRHQADSPVPPERRTSPERPVPPERPASPERPVPQKRNAPAPRTAQNISSERGTEAQRGRPRKTASRAHEKRPMPSEQVRRSKIKVFNVDKTREILKQRKKDAGSEFLSAGDINVQKTAGSSVGSEKAPRKRSVLREFFSLKPDGYLQSRISPGRRAAILIFTLAAALALILCVYGSFSISGLTIRESSQMYFANKSDSKNFRIVYSTKDAFGAEAARSLQARLLAKTGASLQIVTDSEEPTKNEIRIGYTKRAPDSYVTSLGSLGKNGYAVIFGANGGVDLIAFSKEGAEAAVMCFTDGYGISYLAGNLNFSSSSNLAFVSTDGNEPEPSIYESKHYLSFGEDGQFKTLVLSDTDINTNTTAAIEAMLDGEKPDLVILNGDVSTGFSTKSELEAYLKVLTAPMESRKIPWCHVYGEQDGDAGLSAVLQDEVYASFPYCISKSDFESAGVSSYFLPVFKDAQKDSGAAPIFGIWALGQTGMISGTSVAPTILDSVLNTLSAEGKDYGYIPQTHVTWLSETAEMMKKDSEKGMPTVAVTHTPVYEFNVIADNPEKCGFEGSMGEAVSSSPIQSGLFSALLESKSVLGLYSGHDHLNTYSGKYMGIELGYVSSIGYDGYGYGGTFENNNLDRGGRIIEASVIGGSVRVFSRMVYAVNYGVTRE